MRLFTGRRVNASTPELAEERFLLEVHEDGHATMATRPVDDPSVPWSAPVLLLQEVPR